MDLKALQSALEQLEEEKNISREKILEAIQDALAAAYKKDCGKKGQIVRAVFDMATGETSFSQIKIVVDESMLKPEDETETSDVNEPKKVRFNPEHHIMIEEAKK